MAASPCDQRPVPLGYFAVVYAKSEVWEVINMEHKPIQMTGARQKCFTSIYLFNLFI